MDTPYTIPLYEYFEYARGLETHHAIFNKIWEMGKPVFDDSITTSAVAFNKEGAFIEFKFNTDFWHSLTFEQRKFVIAHESLHVLLDHGYRSSNLFNKIDMQALQAANLAMDVVINESLIHQFEFHKQQIDPDNNYMWLDKISSPALANQNFEYYYNLIYSDLTNKDQYKSYQSSGNLDNHDSLPSLSDIVELEKQLQNNIDDISDDSRKKLAESLKNETAPEFQTDPISSDSNKICNTKSEKGGRFAGKIGTGTLVVMPPQRIIHKRKWETIIKKWMIKCQKEDYDLSEVWQDVNRRIGGMMAGNNIYLPTEIDTEVPSKNKILVYFFLDVSSSCQGLGPRFWRAAKSLPKNRFDVKLFCFNTSVYAVSPNGEGMRSGGGTDFHILENQIQADVNADKLKRYPAGVFVITDGYGSTVKPKKPKNWHWFLTENSTLNYLPKESIVHKLKDFE